ncbi:MAG TPA: hypothetical protein DCY35_09735 [Prolixibacteraceae bacterium]|nr:hypothetical protein [Prolixibacteraceae bacterium]
MKRFSFKNIQIFGLFRHFTIVAGILFLLLVGLSFTTLPYWGYHWLGTSLSEIKSEPETIILLGGSGMPSESNLIRTWFAANAASDFLKSQVLVVMPGEPSDPTSTPARIFAELKLRGVDSVRIVFEPKGTNTRSQALECSRILSPNRPVLLVTSPENMRRSILSFRKAGFIRVYALPAFENAAEADFSFIDDELGKSPAVVPDVGKSTGLRYQFWNHMKYEILIARELVALAYYRLRGWI